MKINSHSEAKGKCKICGKQGPQYFIQSKGKRKGERFLDHSAYVKVFSEVSWFRGDDEYLGKFCKSCFKNKEYLKND